MTDVVVVVVSSNGNNKAKINPEHTQSFNSFSAYRGDNEAQVT